MNRPLYRKDIEQLQAAVLPTNPAGPVVHVSTQIQAAMQAVIDAQRIALELYAEHDEAAEEALRQATLLAAASDASSKDSALRQATLDAAATDAASKADAARTAAATYTSQYVEPFAAMLRDSLAYATYRDAQYTAAAPLTLVGGTRTRLTNTGTVLVSTRPARELEWLRTNKLYPGYVGDTYQIRINCTVEATAPLSLELENELIFPAIAGGPALEIISTSGRTVGTRLGGLAKKLSFYHTVYCGERFLSNGCEVYITANPLQGALPVGLGMRIYDISFALFRFRQGQST